MNPRLEIFKRAYAVMKARREAGKGVEDRS